MQIDLNCDLGEGCAHDAELLRLIQSANIACGGHAGDADTMAETLLEAKGNGVAAGAHPGFCDREHFGRRELPLSEDQIFRLCVTQIGALVALGRSVGVEIRYVKPHGGLYNLACRERGVARPVVRAADFFGLPLMGLPRSALEAELRATTRLEYIAEGFADRRYRPDGTLVPRSEPGAMIESTAEAISQVEWLITHAHVRTICVHGDTANAVEMVRELRAGLHERGHTLRRCY
jgi:UPF0271 protein